jgi:DNA primase
MLDSPIDEIKSRVSILDVVADYVQLKKAGTNFKAPCPFHNEKTPSFMVSPSKQIWHCFGCGLGGDIFEFIKQAENVEFGEALKILADRAGIVLKPPTKEQIQAISKKDVLYDINTKASEYFQRVLWETNAGKEALEYLRKRGLNDQTIKKWSLGFAPEDFHYLENHLAKLFSKPDIEATGLIIKKDHESRNTNHVTEYFDRFRGRVMFPIKNLHGQTVGFTGRILKNDPNVGKYVNSPETLIYNKSQVIFGLDQAKNLIRKENRAVLVEGQMDVITAHQAGFTQTVASSGTAFTLDQLNTLKRFTENLVFAFDADSAGVEASRRVLELALGLGFNVKVLEMKEAKDPDELIKKGIGLWQKSLDNARNFVEFFFDKSFAKYDSQTPEGKREIAKELSPLVFRITEPVARAHFVRRLANGINIAETAVWEIINKLDVPKEIRDAVRTQPKKPRNEMLWAQLLGLALVLEDNSYLQAIATDDCLPLYRKIFKILKSSSDLDLVKLSQNHSDLKQQFELLHFSLSTEIEGRNLDPKDEYMKVFQELRRIILKQKMEALSEQLQNAEKNHNSTLASQLATEYVTLSNQLKNI